MNSNYDKMIFNFYKSIVFGRNEFKNLEDGIKLSLSKA